MIIIIIMVHHNLNDRWGTWLELDWPHPGVYGHQLSQDRLSKWIQSLLVSFPF